MSAQMITDSTPDPLVRSCIRKAAPESRARVAKLAPRTGAGVHGVMGGNNPALQQQLHIVCYHRAADAQPSDLRPTDPGADQTGTVVAAAGVAPSATTQADKIAPTIDAETVTPATSCCTTRITSNLRELRRQKHPGRQHP